MTDETDTTSEVARVLIDHTRLTFDGKCHCGFQGRLGESFTAHQAEALAEAGLLRRAGTDHLAEDLRENTEALLLARGRVERLRTAMRNPNGYFYVADLMPDLRRALEDPQIATQEPAEQPRADSAGRGTSEGTDGAPEGTSWIEHRFDEPQEVP